MMHAWRKGSSLVLRVAQRMPDAIDLADHRHWISNFFV